MVISTIPRYYNTNQEEDNQEQQLQDWEPLSANNGTKRLQQPMPILYKTLLKPYLVSVQQPTQQSHHLVLIQPIQLQLAMILVFLKMINWNQFLQEEKDMNDNLSTINDDDKTFYMEQLNLNIGQTPNNNNNNNHGVSETENDLLPGTSKSLIAKYHYQLNYGDENENETND